MNEYLKGKLKINIADILKYFSSSQEELIIELNPCKIIEGTIAVSYWNQVNKIIIIHEQGSQDYMYLYNGSTLLGYIYDFQTYMPEAEFSIYAFSSYNDYIDRGDLVDLIWKDDNDKSIFTFKLNDERNKLDKNLIFDSVITGTFKSVINCYSLILDIMDYKIENTFNYVYISSLNRFYYVDSVDLKTNKISSLTLSEDVLMSHKELIRRQTGFIVRNQYTFHDNIVDDLVVANYNKNVEYTNIPYTNDIFSFNGYPYEGDYIVLTVMTDL